MIDFKLWLCRLAAPLILFLLPWTLCVAADTTYSEDALADEVLWTDLPGAENLKFETRQFSGFIDVPGHGGKKIHYWFIESDSNPESAPVTMWTNGGPGCSGLLGMFTEQGPFRVDADMKLYENPFRWNLISNMLFIEQPAGVGFSYADGPEMGYKTGDVQATKDMYNFIQGWFDRFSQYKSNDFYITSESYGGHYMPLLTQYILKTEDASPTFLTDSFRGMAVGNPYIDIYTNNVAMYERLWGDQIITAPIYDEWKGACTTGPRDYLDNIGRCSQLEGDMASQISNINLYALDYPICLDGEAPYTQSGLVASGAADGISDAGAGFGRAGSAQGRRLLQVMQQWRARATSLPIPPAKAAAAAAGSSVLVLSRDRHLQLRLRGAREKAEEKESLAVGRDATKSLPPPPPVPSQPRKRRSEAPTTSSSSPTTSSAAAFAYNPCASLHAVQYLNTKDVQSAIHVPPSQSTPHSEWVECASRVDYDQMDSFHTMVPVVQDVLTRIAEKGTTSTSTSTSTREGASMGSAGIKVLVYSGDDDSVCATSGTQEWVWGLGDLAAPIKAQTWQPWSTPSDNQLGGFYTKYTTTAPSSSSSSSSSSSVRVGGEEGDAFTEEPTEAISEATSASPNAFAFVTVHNAGHEVPAYKPEAGLVVFEKFISGEWFE